MTNLLYLIANDDVEVLTLFVQHQSPDNNTLNELIKLSINENKVQCFSYLFSLPRYEEFISYYDLLSYSSSSSHMDIIAIVCSTPSSDMYERQSEYLFLLLGIVAQECYEATTYLLQHLYIDKFNSEDIQHLLNETLNTVIRNISMNPHSRLVFDSSSPNYQRVVSCMYSLYELGAVFTPYSGQTISKDMQIILDQILFNQQLQQDLSRQEDDAKPKL